MMSTLKTAKKPTKKTTPAASTTPEVEPLTIAVDGKTYVVDSLPNDIKDIVTIYQSWEQELNKQRIEVFKLEAALHGAALEIEKRIKDLSAAE